MSRRVAYALVDWGTTSFRAWACASDGTVLNERRAPEGSPASSTATSRGADAAPLCDGRGGRYAGHPVRHGRLADGLGRGGLPVGSDTARRPRHPRDAGSNAGRPVHILPGLAQRGDAPDVMRGEETQLLGVVADGFDTGLVCMPGTHEMGEAGRRGRRRLSTFMTGELFQQLCAPDRSCVRRSKAPSRRDRRPKASPKVRRGLSPSCHGDQRAVPAAGGLAPGRRAPSRQAARLSGLMIGLEFAGATALYGNR